MVAAAAIAAPKVAAAMMATGKTPTFVMNR